MNVFRPVLHLIKYRPVQIGIASGAYLGSYLLLSLAVRELTNGPDQLPWSSVSGLSFALLLLGGSGYFPLVILTMVASAAWVLHLAIDLSTLGAVLLVGLSYALAAGLVRRQIPDFTQLGRLHEMAVIILAALLTPLAVALVSAGLPMLAGGFQPAVLAGQVYQDWIGAALSNLVLGGFLLVCVPLALAWLRRRLRGAAVVATGKKNRVWIAQVLVLLAMLGLVFGLLPVVDRRAWYLMFLPLMWIILSYGLPGAVLSSLTISAAALLLSTETGMPGADYGELHIFLMLLALTCLIAGAVFSENRASARALRYRLSIEEHIATISTHFVGVAGERVDEEIQRALQEMAEFYGVEASYLLLFQPDKIIYKVYEWTESGVPTWMQDLEGSSLETLPWLMSKMERGEALAMNGRLPRAERNWIEQHKLLALISVPILVDGRLLGALGFHSQQVEKPWKAEDMRLLHLLADIFFNVLERGRVENLVRDSDLKYRSIVLQSTDGIALVGEGGMVIEWNRGLERITGIRRSQALGRPVWDVQFRMLPPEKKDAGLYERSKDQILQLMQSASPSWPSQPVEYEIMHSDGQRRYVESLVFPIRSGSATMIGNITRDVTEQRQSEAALRRSQANLAEAEQLAHLGHFRFSVADGTMEWSDETFRILEWSDTRSQPNLKSLLPLIAKQDQAGVMAMINQVIQSNAPAECEYHLPMQDGRVKTIHSIGRPVLDGEGNLTHIFGTLMDITERKQAEQSRSESDRRYKELADSISDVFFGLDSQLHLTYWNRASQELTGIPAEKAIGRSFYEVFPQLKGTSVEQFALEAFRSQQQQGFVMEYRVGQRKHYLEVSAYPSENGVSVFLRDVTERQKAEDLLRQSEARYRAVVEDQIDMICRFLPDGKVTFVNQSYCRSFGRQRREVVGHPFMRLINDQIGQEPNGEFSVLRGTSQAKTYICQVLLADNLLHWIQWTDRPVLDDHGRIVEYQSVGRDISESKRLEEELRYMSTHDVLTGIYNRAFFETEVSRLQRSRLYPISVLMADVNSLKNTNDTRGHPAGDELLKRAARVLSSSFRPEDIVARFGGDEFAVLLPETDERAANDVLQRVRNNLEAFNRGSNKPPLSLSIGICTGKRGDSLLEVLNSADERMYKDKLRQKKGG